MLNFHQPFSIKHREIKGFNCHFLFYLSADIYDEVSTSLQGLGLETECLGGGRIDHNAANKHIKVYGYSQVSSVGLVTHPISFPRFLHKAFPSEFPLL